MRISSSLKIAGATALLLLGAPAWSDASKEAGWNKFTFKKAPVSVDVPCSAAEVEQALASGPPADQLDPQVACIKMEQGIAFVGGLNKSDAKDDGFSAMWSSADAEKSDAMSMNKSTDAQGRRVISTKLKDMNLEIRFVEMKNDKFVVLAFLNMLGEATPASQKMQDQFFNSLVISDAA